jgi:hypothetical protein
VRASTVWLIVAVLIIAGFALYFSRRTGPSLNIDPHAREVIEKAKRR